MRTNLQYNKIIRALQMLNKKYPSYNMGRHISTALDGYPDVWGMTDKEFLFALNKYIVEMDIDVPHDENIDLIIKEGLDLSHILDEDDEEI
jgi:hypothetical protein